MFAVALLIVALGFAAWGFYSRESEKGTPASAAPAATPPSQPPSDSGAAPAEVAKASQPTVSSTAGGESSPTPAANPPASVPNQSSSQIPLSQTPLSTPLSQDSLSPNPRTGRFVVLIKAREDSWLSVSIDGEVTTQGLLTASTEKSVRAQKELTIKAGNIGALDLEFNGKKLPAQGGYGEVKTLTFDANGLRPPGSKPEEPAQLP
jgi:hypothetical protein